MSSNLKVNTILPSTGTTIGIGTVGGLINVVGNIDVNSTSGISTFNGLEISGIVTAKAGAAVTYYGDGSNLTGILKNIVEDSSPQLGGTLDANNYNIHLGDNVSTRYGASQDLDIYHSGANGIIVNNTGELRIRGNDVRLMNNAGNEHYFVGFANGYSAMYYDNSQKIKTESGGVTVTGTVAATSYTGDGSNLTGISAGTSLSGSTNNTVCTVTGANAIQGEANLTFDGSVLTNTGSTLIGNDIKSASDDFFVYSYKGGSDGQVRSGIQFDSTNQRMEFYTGTNERMRIETNGDLKFNSGYSSVNTAYGIRAWIAFKAAGGSNTVRGSGNATITDHGTGDFTMNFTTAMPDTGYSAVGTAGYNSGQIVLGLTGSGTESVPTTSGFRFSIRANYNNNSLMDEEYINLMVVR